MTKSLHCGIGRKTCTPEAFHLCSQMPRAILYNSSRGGTHANNLPPSRSSHFHKPHPARLRHPTTSNRSAAHCRGRLHHDSVPHLGIVWCCCRNRRFVGIRIAHDTIRQVSSPEQTSSLFGCRCSLCICIRLYAERGACFVAVTHTCRSLCKHAVHVSHQPGGGEGHPASWKPVLYLIFRDYWCLFTASRASILFHASRRLSLLHSVHEEARI